MEELERDQFQDEIDNLKTTIRTLEDERDVLTEERDTLQTIVSGVYDLVRKNG